MNDLPFIILLVGIMLASGGLWGCIMIASALRERRTIHLTIVHRHIYTVTHDDDTDDTGGGGFGVDWKQGGMN